MNPGTSGAGDFEPAKRWVIFTRKMTPCSNPLSDQEWAGFAIMLPNGEKLYFAGARDFPYMIRCHTCKLGEATATYNCLAWVLDDTTRVVWDEADTDQDKCISVQEIKDFLASEDVTPGTVAIYGRHLGDVTHVARLLGPGRSCSATSKRGTHILMAHDPSELIGFGRYGYGDIIGGY